MWCRLWRGSGGRRAPGVVDYSRKEDFQWISMIRLPEFVNREAFDWAIREATQKKQQDFSKVEFYLLGRGTFASSVCTLAPMTPSLSRWQP